MIAMMMPNRSEASCRRKWISSVFARLSKPAAKAIGTRLPQGCRVIQRGLVEIDGPLLLSVAAITRALGADFHGRMHKKRD